MKSFSYLIIAALAAILASCTRTPEAPLPGDALYAECHDCQEFIESYFLKVVPSAKKEGMVSVWHTNLEKYVLEDVKPDWRKIPGDKGSQVLVETFDRKFGFFDTFLGISIIKPVHHRAWPFSEGLCAVEDNGQIRFFNQHGMDFFDYLSFPYYGTPLDDFVFRHGVCAVPGTNSRCGVINRFGEWVLEPRYRDIVVTDDGILALDEGKRILFSFDGKVINPFVVDEVSPIRCNGKETGLFRYEVAERYGMMDKDGHPLTDAVYKEIKALSPTLFRSYIHDEEFQVILDTKGQVVG